jgi:hypothetical protein
MRKRTANNDLLEVTRPFGELNKNEIEEIRQAYRDKCNGEILIGLRGEERVITMLLPAQTNKETGNAAMNLSIDKLKRMRCDRHIHVHRENNIYK